MWGSEAFFSASLLFGGYKEQVLRLVAVISNHFVNLEGKITVGGRCSCLNLTVRRGFRTLPSVGLSRFELALAFSFWQP